MSEKSKHTPGPWALSKSRAGHSIVCASGRTVAAAHLLGTIHPVDEVEANAHLIAAAPEMYEALKWARILLDIEGKYSLIGIDMALAKAEGRTNG